MNQDQNNLNQINLNTQGNNGIPDNQPLNNQSFNQESNLTEQTNVSQPQQTQTLEQTLNQTNMEQPTTQNVSIPENNTIDTLNLNNNIENQSSQSVSNQDNLYSQSTPNFQQSSVQEPIPEPNINNNQSFDNISHKKINLGLFLGVGAAVVVIGLGIIFGRKLFTNNTNSNYNNSNSNNQTITNSIQTEESKSKIKLKSNAKVTEISVPNYKMDVDLSWMDNLLEPIDINNGSYESQSLELINKLPGEWEVSKLKHSGDGVNEYTIAQTYILKEYDYIFDNYEYGATYITSRLMLNSSISDDKRLVLNLEFYGNVNDDIEKNISKMLNIGSKALGNDLMTISELVEGINNLKSKDVYVSLNVSDNNDSKIFGSIILRLGKDKTTSDEIVRLTILIGKNY